MRERKFVGSGFEHSVYESRFKEIVLKKPSFLNLVSLFLLSGKPADQVRKEIEINKAECAKSGVLVPETRVFPFENGYIIAQRKIIDDGSVGEEEMENRIKSGSELIYYAYKIQKDNFIGNEGNIYMVDLTMGIFRQTDFFLSYETQNHLKAAILEKLRHKW